MKLRTRLLLLVVSVAGIAIGAVTVVATTTAERLVLDEVDRGVTVAARAPGLRNWDPSAGRVGPPSGGAPGNVPGGGNAGPPGPGGGGGPGGGPAPQGPPSAPGGAPSGFDADMAATAWVGITTRGDVLSASPAGPFTDPYPIPKVAAMRGADGQFVIDELRTIESETDPSIHYRAVVERATPGNLVLVAQPIDRAFAEIAQIRATGAGAAVTALALVAIVGFLGIRRSLRPLERMEATVAEIADGHIDRRVTVTNPGDEVGRLSASFNVMVDKIDAAFKERDLAERQLRQFVADASHELRTPLTSIVGYADLHGAGALTGPGQTDHAMDRIGSEALRLMTLVEDLLTLARLDQGRPMRIEPVDVSTIVEEVVADARAADPERAIDSTVPARLVVDGDGDQLRQVLTNLVANARTHTPTDSPISVLAEGDADEVRVTVGDRGAGLDDETARRVFDRFWRGDTARSRDTGGAGLGLPIADSIVSAHGGRITLDSEVGRGSRFCVHLPLRPAEPATVARP